MTSRTGIIAALWFAVFVVLSTRHIRPSDYTGSGAEPTVAFLFDLAVALAIGTVVGTFITLGVIWLARRVRNWIG